MTVYNNLPLGFPFASHVCSIATYMNGTFDKFGYFCKVFSNNYTFQQPTLS